MTMAHRRFEYRLALFAAGGAVALTCGATAARAQAGPAAAQIQEVVVTAQRRSQNLQDVPVSVQALSGGDLQAAGIKSTQDLGQVTPNVTIVSPIGQGNQPLITIRGIGLNDFDTNNAGPNGVYVDDVYISAPSAQSFALFDLSQVQVLKGPQGTLYGRNTSGGAIVFTSNRPTDHLTGDLPATERAAVVLRYGYDLDYSDIATALGSSEAAARQAASSGVRRRRRRMT